MRAQLEKLREKRVAIDLNRQESSAAKGKKQASIRICGQVRISKVEEEEDEEYGWDSDFD